MVSRHYINLFAEVFTICEDPDINLADIQDADVLEQLVARAPGVYQSLPEDRKEGLRQAVGYMLTLNEDSDVDTLKKFVPRVYPRIWGTKNDPEITQKIIDEELDFEKYARGIKHVLELNRGFGD